MKPGVPPDAVAETLPFAFPQIASADDVAIEIAVGWVMVAEVDTVQPFASVMVTLYPPAGMLLAVDPALTAGVHA